jgi:hypothetical protein
MPKKNIMIGNRGEIVLKRDMLSHLKVKPGEELSYKLMPGNKLILESIIAQQKNSEKEIKSNKDFELADLRKNTINESINIYSIPCVVENDYLAH